MRLHICGSYTTDRATIHARVRAEAGNHCIRCHHPNEGLKRRQPCTSRCDHPQDGKPRVLTVHHLDGDKANNAWWNLLALCQVCHLSVQGGVIPERPWLFEHSDWFQPYVAGFYAHYYGGQELSREAVEANLDHFLAFGQPWRYEGSVGCRDHDQQGGRPICLDVCDF